MSPHPASPCHLSWTMTFFCMFLREKFRIEFWALYTLWESSMARWKIHGKSHESSMIFPVKAPCGIDTGDIPSLPCWQRRAYQKWFWKITCFTMFYLNHLHINGNFPYLHLPKGNHWTMRRTREEPLGDPFGSPERIHRRSLVPRPETRWSCRCHWCHWCHSSLRVVFFARR